MIGWKIRLFATLGYEKPPSLLVETNYQGNNFYHATAPLRASSRVPVTIPERWEMIERWMGIPHKLRDVTEVTHF
jgi:hypothetical protein